ncbi:unnamed protein product [Candidula unifasciata]|uniref:Cytochrome P450 n=1 Tax=Candidula unifasciata TaxID=100452 RepID=A0A8S3Z282_9EUPU|nr:unnamed protein product [Candidula unifasciata]
MAAVETWTVASLLSGATVYLVLATVAVLFYFIYSKLSTDDNWDKYGVKQVNMGLTDFRTACADLIQQHGDTIGVKRFQMQLISRDLDILKNVMVKDFNNFVDRMTVFRTKSLVKKGLFFLEGDDWRRIRHVLSPSFASGKLKHISKTIDDTAVKLANVLEHCARTNKNVEIKHLTGQYTSEIIAKTAFGLQTECLGGEDDQFTDYCKKLFKSRSSLMTKAMIVLFRFPWLHSFLLNTLGLTMFDTVNEESNEYLTSTLHRTLAEREEYERSQGRKPTDLLQSLVSAKMAGDREEAVNATTAADSTKTDPSDRIPKTMTQDELIGQSILIIFAGFETTATTLQFCLYLLAKHPGVQEKLYEEIQTVVSGENPTLEELGQLRYLEQVINETLRLFPPAPIMSRKAAETRKYGHITIPKGAVVIIPIFLVLKDPKHFPDPEKFDPDRFTEENKATRDPMAFMPFGYGPRLCLGMRLAYLELKIALVHVLRKVTFELNDTTVPKLGGDIEIKKGAPLLTPVEPVQLCVKQRHP